MEHIINDIKDKIGEGNLRDALKDAKYLFWQKPEYREYLNDLIIINLKFNSFRKNQIIGTHDQNTENVQLSQISHSLIGLLDLFMDHQDGEGLDFPMPEKNEVELDLLAIVPDKAAQAAIMDEFFTPLSYRSVRVITPEDEIELEEYDLIILDNRHLGPVRNNEDLGHLTDEQYEYYMFLKNRIFEPCLKANRHVMHLGEELQLLRHYRRISHAANSLFALHARIGEIRDFIRDYNPRPKAKTNS